MIEARRAVAAAICLATALPASAQSLADVARQEAARRDSVAQPAKAYTNADLKVDPLTSHVSAPAAGEAEQGGYLSISAGRYVTAEELIANSNANIPTGDKILQEPHWRGQAESLRGQLMKLQQDVAALAATVDDESRPASERAVADRLVAQKQVVIEDLERRWLKMEKQAEIQRIPKAWLDPRPTLSTQTPQ